MDTATDDRRAEVRGVGQADDVENVTGVPKSHETSTAAVQSAALRLYNYLVRAHWNDEVLAGPDVGVRFNSRIGRFVKGYLPFIAWRDDLVHAQTQKYWIAVNWALSDLGLVDSAITGQAAEAAANYLLNAQTDDGYWAYPNPEWKGRIATVEGNYACLGMLQTFERTGDERLLEASVVWHEYTIDRIGFQAVGDTLAINYFGNVRRGRVPNNTASLLPLYAKLTQVTGNERYSEKCPALVRFLEQVQLPSGELPYSVSGEAEGDRPHFLCFQYNAFEYLNLANYWDWSGDQAILPVLERLAEYLATGLTERGAARYDCHQDRPELPYYTAAVAAALSRSVGLGHADNEKLAQRAFSRVLGQQYPSGAFYHSAGNYGVLTDRRSYPRNQAMIASHLLEEVARRRLRNVDRTSEIEA